MHVTEYLAFIDKIREKKNLNKSQRYCSNKPTVEKLDNLLVGSNHFPWSFIINENDLRDT